jgi:flagellar hook-associated protein 2
MVESVSNKTRVTGLASGLDTEKLVSDLMKAERIPINKLSEKKQVTEWQRDAYREITSGIKALKDEYLDVIKPESYMLSQNLYKKFDVNSSDASKVTGKVVDASLISCFSRRVEVSRPI